MADVFTKPKRSEVMSRIRSSGNRETELAMMALFPISFWQHELTQKHRAKALRKLRKAGLME